MKCVEMNWMCILVGPPASGKTNLVRLLARLTGNCLHEFAMNSGVDTTGTSTCCHSDWFTVYVAKIGTHSCRAAGRLRASRPSSSQEGHPRQRVATCANTSAARVGSSAALGLRSTAAGYAGHVVGSVQPGSLRRRPKASEVPL
jgi:energy-coupling factor transporter ATP-binding protein EcfA2